MSKNHSNSSRLEKIPRVPSQRNLQRGKHGGRATDGLCHLQELDRHAVSRLEVCRPLDSAGAFLQVVDERSDPFATQQLIFPREIANRRVSCDHSLNRDPEEVVAGFGAAALQQCHAHRPAGKTHLSANARLHLRGNHA